MTVRQLLDKARNKLQDHKKIFWDDPELLDYYGEARRVLAAERTEKQQEKNINMLTGQNLYSTTGILRYMSIKDSLGNVRTLYRSVEDAANDIYGVVVIDYDQINVIDETISPVLTITYIGLPLDQNLNDTVRQGDEASIEYFVLARAYEKESIMENFAKSQTFEVKFQAQLKKLMNHKAIGHVEQSVHTTQSYSY